MLALALAFWSAGSVVVAPDSAARVLRDTRDGSVRRGALSIVSQNILAPVYASAGGYDVPADVLAWPRRCAELCAQLEAYDADIVMLQEVEPASFAPDFDRLLETCGYEAVLQADDPKRPYANAVLFRRDRFEVVSAESRSRAQIVVLLERAQSTGATAAGESSGGDEPHAPRAYASGGASLLYLANVHLQKGSQSQLTRLLQLRSLFKHLAHHREVQGRVHSAGGKRGGRAARNGGAKTGAVNGRASSLAESSVICGDFNCGRQSEVYELMREGGLRKFPSTQRRPDGTLGGGAKAYRTGFLPLKDAYVASAPPWGPFTYTHCSGALLDYMWVSMDLDVLVTLPRSHTREDLARGLQDAPTKPVGEPTGAHEPRRPLPSRDGRYISDHLPSGAVLAPRLRADRDA